jgi:hypothetical protein
MSECLNYGVEKLKLCLSENTTEKLFSGVALVIWLLAKTVLVKTKKIYC